jgi:hypothetical protein
MLHCGTKGALCDCLCESASNVIGYCGTEAKNLKYLADKSQGVLCTANKSVRVLKYGFRILTAPHFVSYHKLGVGICGGRGTQRFL